MLRRLITPLCIAMIAMTTSFAGAADIVETAVGAGQFKTLVTAVQAAGLVDTLKGTGPFTVFAPTDEAFANLPQGTVETLLKPENKAQLQAVLTYHVVPAKVTARDAFAANSAPTVNGQRLIVSREQGKLQVSGANVVKTDILCDNGVIHVIDAVMLPASKTIPEVAKEAGQFETLLAAVTTAELAGVLSGEGPFTVLAPTDEAFAKLPKGTVETLLKPESREDLVNILKYHVISGRVYSDQAVAAGSAKTLQGQSVKVNFSADGVMVNEAKVVTADVDAANGVIHIIDQVLLPKKMTTADARRMIIDAINTGAPMYNHGDHHGCAEVYEAACQRVMSLKTDIPGIPAQHLESAMNKITEHHTATQKAWTMRYGMDRFLMATASD